MSSTISFEPYFPRELERLIFELAVSENGVKASTPLLLIAKRVHEWIRPLIFRVLMHGPWFLSNVPYLPEVQVPSVGHFVQHLLIVGSGFDNSLRTALSSCSNLLTLTILNSLQTKDLLPILQQMPRLTRLTANFYDVSHDDFLIAPFSNLTHLGIEEFTPNGRSWEGRWEALTHLPKLTHIFMSHKISLEVVSKLLLDCPILKVMIATPIENVDALKVVNDNRFVLLKFLYPVNLIHDWEKGVNGGVDIWNFCDLIVMARSRNYFVTPYPPRIARNFNWEKFLNEDGKKWFSALKLDDPQLKSGTPWKVLVP